MLIFRCLVTKNSKPAIDKALLKSKTSLLPLLSNGTLHKSGFTRSVLCYITSYKLAFVTH